VFHATTILAYKGKNKSVIGGDGQVSFGNTVLKGNAVKIRKIHGGKVLAGFAGSHIVNYLLEIGLHFFRRLCCSLQAESSPKHHQNFFHIRGKHTLRKSVQLQRNNLDK